MFFKSQSIMNDNNNVVIMAGGVGSRFWPMSTADCPKQFIDVLGVGKSLLQLTYNRFKDLCPADKVWVVTHSKYFDLVHEQLPDIPVENILLEPVRRNTAPCIAYVSWKIKKNNPKANIVVTPSDHIVVDEKDFRRVINSCLEFTNNTDAIVTLGITPTRPETGYGYIQADFDSPSLRNKEIFRIDSFKEKPDLETAKQYISNNNYFWNAGIFVWNVSTIVNAFRMYCPQIGKLFESILDVYGTPEEAKAIEKAYSECESISVDYAIMEKVEDIFVCPSNFGWSDLGTWGALLTQTSHDIYGNGVIGENIKLYDSHNCIVHATQAKQVIIQGLDNYIVAEKDGSLLICKLEEEQRIRGFAEENS